MTPRRLSLMKTISAAGAFMMAVAAAPSQATTYLGPVNGAECYTPEVMNEELDMGYGQSPTVQAGHFVGPWRSVTLYRNREDRSWSLVGKPYEEDARRITGFDNLLCLIDSGEGEEYRENPYYRRLLGIGAPSVR